MSQPNYLNSVMHTLNQNASRIRPGSVHEMRVAHDSWCGIFQSRVCNCNPVTELIEIGADSRAADLDSADRST